MASAARRNPATSVSVGRHYRPTILWVALFSMVINLLMLAGPLYMLQVYDRVLASGSVPTLIGLSTMVLVAYGFQMLLDMLRHRVLARISAGLDARVSPKAYALNFDPAARAALRENRIEPIPDLDRVRQFIGGGGLAAAFDLPWVPI